ncbi:hypothetical protein GCM10010276_38210 [Streptomyces longisporus]|uniref:Uncharacterized protein n=1 Tax=Streptomyces longisporus TaxID=1948 RepID=A0ABP5Z8C7_STRLO
MRFSVQWMVDTTYSSWSNMQGDEEHFDEEQTELTPVRRTGVGVEAGGRYRSRVEAREQTSQTTMPSIG